MGTLGPGSVWRDRAPSQRHMDSSTSLSMGHITGKATEI